MKKLLITLWTCLSMSAMAQESLMLHYDFEDDQGRMVRDKSASHFDAALKGSATLENGMVYLGYDSGYIDMGEAVGKRLQQLHAFTIAVHYKVDREASLKGQGYFLWAFSTLPLNTQTEGRYHAYKLNVQRAENSIGGWKRETLMDIGRASDKGEWLYVVYTQDEADGRLYLNGRLVASNDSMFTLSTTFPAEAPTYNWMGRAPFKGDSYLKGTSISDVRMYSAALSEQEVQNLYENIKQEELQKQPKPLGTIYPAEWTSYKDAVSGFEIKVLTDTTSHDSFVYQTDPMWSSDQRFLLFRSRVRAGGEKRQGQFFLMEMASGRMLQITEGEHGSLFMANRSNHLFINRRVDVADENQKPTGEQVWNLYKLNIDRLWEDALAGKVKAADAYEEHIASMPMNDSVLGRPGGWCISCEDDFAYIVVSRKGTEEEEQQMLAQAFRPANNQPIKIKPSLGGVRKIDLKTGEVSVVVNTLFKVGHIQASRYVNDEILFCNETGGDAHQRIWFVRADGSEFRPIYKETPLDWVTHETFQTRDHVYFNILGFQDLLRKQASGIMRINLRNDDVECLGNVELSGENVNGKPLLGGRGFWHCNSTRDGRYAAGDTFAGNVYVINVATGERRLIATDCRMKPDHAHPHFSPCGRYLLFQSGHFTDGKRLNLMMVDLEQLHW